MGNHVHVILEGYPGADRIKIGLFLRRHKNHTGKRIKSVLSHTGDVWETGCFDRYVRPGTFWTVLQYLLNNPVKARLAKTWSAWPHTWVRPGLLEEAPDDWALLR